MKAEVKMDGNFLHVFGVGKLGHEPFVTLSRLFHGLFYLFFLRFVRVWTFHGFPHSVLLFLHEVE